MDSALRNARDIYSTFLVEYKKTPTKLKVICNWHTIRVREWDSEMGAS